MQKMNNKKGVKLLAAIMVLTIAFAGFAIVSEFDEADATFGQTDLPTATEKD